MLENMKFNLHYYGHITNDITVIPIHELGVGIYWTCKTSGEAHHKQIPSCSD